MKITTVRSINRLVATRLTGAVIVLAGALLLTEIAAAQTVWQAGTGNWFTAANWTLGVPNSASGTAFDATIANDGTAQLLSAGGSVRRLRLGGNAGNGNLLVDGGTLSVTQNLFLGESIVGGATMTVKGGATVNAVVTVVQYSSDDGSHLQITGSGTVYNATLDFVVGRAGNGIAGLSVDSGGVLASGRSFISSDGGFGVATVDGAGSRWSTTDFFIIGGVSAGTLNIQNQGVVHVGTFLNISSTSHVNLNGGTLRFITATGLNRVNFTAGNVQLGGTRIIGADPDIAALFGSSPTIPAGKGLILESADDLRGTVAVDGGAFTVHNSLRVGNNVNANLSVSNGGDVTVLGNAILGVSAFVTGSATVAGPGSTLTVGGMLEVGVAGAGTLFIQNGGEVSANHLRINRGLVQFLAGTLVAPTITVVGGGAGEILWNGGALSVETYNGNLTNGGGALAPGRTSGGNTRVIGNYTQQSAGKLEISIGGTGAGVQHDFIEVTGAASLDGLLNLSLIGGFVPSPTDSFNVLTAGSLAGFFDNAGSGQRVMTTDGGGSFLVHYGAASIFNPNQIRLTNFQAAGALLAADFDSNGVVNGADLAQWGDDFGRTGGATKTQGNADGDGDVDGADFLAWQRQFGSPAAAAATTSVPEPAGAAYLIIGALCWLSWRRLQPAR